MSNSSDQNGRQPPVLLQTAPPTDPRTRNVSDQQIKICRDYAWGICTKGSQCKFRHELDPEAMKSIIKFCHDFQNRTGCTRADCTYLHSSREEETLFLTAGQIPRALAERHSAMSLAPTGSVPLESIPQNMYMPEPYMSHPPPRPSLPGMMQGVTAPPPPPPPPLPASALPPPPPPPPPTANSTSVRMTAPMFSGPPPLNPTVVYTASQPPPPLPPLFDASRPPPPLPVQTIKKTNIAVKRSIAGDTCEAGPSKRKAEGPNIIEGPCENCIQRELRIEIYRQKMQKMHCEEEYQSLIYKKKLEEYETGRALLKSAIGPELFRILDEDIEGTSQSGQVQDLLAQYNQTQTIKPVAPTVPNQLLLQLMECLLNKRNVIDSAPATPLLDVDELVQSLLALKRRQSPAPSRSSSDVLNTILEAMRNSATSGSSQERAEPPVDRAGPSTVPPTGSLTGPSAGSSAVPSGAYGARFVNGQKTESAPPPVPVTRYPAVAQNVCAGVATRGYPAPAPAPVYTAPQPPAPTYSAPQPPAPAYHPPYQPAVPPPARPYYAHQHYHNAGANAAPGPSTVYPSRVAAPPAVPATAPVPAPHNAQYSYPPAPWRHPAQSRYYPPAQ